jgi:hypothetical protein
MNYKIRITSENQAIVKRIADDNGMNPLNLTFVQLGYFYIKNGIFPVISRNDNFLDWTELTTDQFIEMFDKKETEWQPKRGDRVLAWDDSEDLAKDFIFLEYIKGSNYPCIVVSKSNEENFIKNIDFGTSLYKHMKPLPIEQPKETDFKTKVIELIEKNIKIRENSIKTNLEDKDYEYASINDRAKHVYKNLLNQIKQL